MTAATGEFGAAARATLGDRPRLSFWQIWNMCFGFLGVQFGFALQNANVSRIFQTLGAEVDDIPMLWIAAPLTGLLVQPIVGYFSDRTWNALGRLKFDLPNPHDVYLHGTPATELFVRPRRDFSHGCVRVEDPIALAEWLLSGQDGWTRARILESIDAGATRTVALGDPARVVFFYLTAEFVPADKTVRFAEDVYGHDARLDACRCTRARYAVVSLRQHASRGVRA